MDTAVNKINTIDDYIKSLTRETGNKLQEIRKVINEEAPEVQEGISYGMPAFKLHGKLLVYFAAFKNHISLYPATSKMEGFLKELKEYKTGKGTIQFPLDKPLPLPLIRDIVRMRVKEVSA